MKIIKPNKKYLESYLDACKEAWNNIHDNYIIHNPNKFNQWKNTIFSEYEKQEKGINLPKGYVPSITYWLISNNKYIGSINIRLKLTKELKNYGGNIGIFIRPSEQGKIYGSSAGVLAIKKAKELKIHPIMATCQESNMTSLRLLLKSPYIKMEIDETEIYGKVQKIRRFWY